MPVTRRADRARGGTLGCVSHTLRGRELARHSRSDAEWEAAGEQRYVLVTLSETPVHMDLLQ